MNNLDSLLDQLAEDGAVPDKGFAARFALPLIGAILLCGVGVSLALDGAFASMATNGIGPIAFKWGFSLALVMMSPIALWSIGRPGRKSRWILAVLAIPFVLVLALFGVELAIAPGIAIGESWKTCLTAMCVMSPIAFAGAVMAMRALAPTDLHRAGLVAGLFGGAVAMTAYAPFCPELGMLYMILFYCLPIAAMGVIGWLAGPRLMRW